MCRVNKLDLPCVGVPSVLSLYNMGLKGKILRIIYRVYIDFKWKGTFGEDTSELYTLWFGIQYRHLFPISVDRTSAT